MGAKFLVDTRAAVTVISSQQNDKSAPCGAELLEVPQKISVSVQGDPLRSRLL